jgi:hypothetical protein
LEKELEDTRKNSVSLTKVERGLADARRLIDSLKREAAAPVAATASSSTTTSTSTTSKVASSTAVAVPATVSAGLPGRVIPQGKRYGPRTWAIGKWPIKVNPVYVPYGTEPEADYRLRLGIKRASSYEEDFVSTYPDFKPSVGVGAKMVKHSNVKRGTCGKAHAWPRDFDKDPIINVVPNFSSAYKTELDRMGKCAVGCVYTSNMKYADKADNFMRVHPGGGDAGPANKCPHQHATVYTMESEVNMGTLMDPRASGFDLVASTMLHSDVPAIYVSAAEYGMMEPVQPKPPKDDSQAYIAALISNCGASNGRNEYMQELMKYVKIDSYGACMNNKKGPDGKGGSMGWFRGKLELIRKYKFTMAMENSNVLDYVSEKLT